jgi:predicted nucleic acid-binding protein
MLSEEELDKLSAMNVSRKLSPPDLSVIILALNIQAMVVTGDNLLRKHCQKAELEVHGILWLFDLFINNQIISKNTSIVKLELLIAQNNRLPKEECSKRLLDWKKE